MKPSRFLVAVALAGLASVSTASDYGCKCLLCLANPNGPRALAECRPPIDRLFRDLARGRPFPTCDLAEGPNGRSYAQPASSYFDMCPSGTTALPPGAMAIQGVGDIPPYTYAGPVYTGIGSGDDWYPSSESFSPPTKVCVGRAVGTTIAWSTTGDFPEQAVVTVYDRMTLLDTQGSAQVIDVYIDDALYRRVRW